MTEPRDDRTARREDVRPYGQEAPYGPPPGSHGPAGGGGPEQPVSASAAGPSGRATGTEPPPGVAGAPYRQGAYPSPGGAPAPGSHPGAGYAPPAGTGYPAPAYAPPGYWPRNDLAVWSLVLAVAGIVLACGFFTGIPAVIIGQNARRAVARGEANNDGMALAGVVLGWVAIALGVLVVLLVLLSFLVPLVFLGVTLPWAHSMSGSGW